MSAITGFGNRLALPDETGGFGVTDLAEFRSVQRYNGPGIISKALVNLNESGIVGSAPVTAWLNSGTGGSPYDLDVVIGTGANLTSATEGGKTVVVSSGSVWMETTSGQTINSPGTVFLVGRISGTPSANMNFMAPRSSSSAIWAIFTFDVSSDKFSINQGVIVRTLSEAFDNDTHIFTGQFNGDSTTKLTVSGVGSVTGDSGPDNWDFGTLFADRAGASTVQGSISQLLVFDFALSEGEIAGVQLELLHLHEISA